MNVKQIAATPISVITCVTCGVTGLAVLSAAIGSKVQAAQLVVPNQHQSAEAPEGGAIPTGPFRFQQLFAASQFASLPPGQRTIASFAMRPDASVTAPVSFTLSDTVIRMSTTNRNPGELNDSFADNVGTDAVVVFAGDLSLSTANTGPAAGPKDFNFVFPLQRPFTYDPSAGNLIFDVETAGTNLVISQTTDFAVSTALGFEEIAAFTAGAELATGRWGGNVIQFTFVPEPPSLILICLGAFTLNNSRRKRQRAGAEMQPASSTGCSIHFHSTAGSK
jgi:hypothetical protein